LGEVVYNVLIVHFPVLLVMAHKANPAVWVASTSCKLSNVQT
jgi:hypothetical protein